MGDYILTTVNYDYKTLNHEGFGGVCKSVSYTHLDVYKRQALHLAPWS